MKSLINPLRCHPRYWQFVQFCLVGGSGVVVDMLVLHFLVDARWLGWHVSLAKFCSAEVAMINNFVWNECWTFGALSVQRPRWRDRLERLAKFHLVCGSGLVLSVGLVSAQVYGLDWNVYLANALAIAIVSVWNFLLNAKFNWKVSEARKEIDGVRGGIGSVPEPSTHRSDNGTTPMPLEMAARREMVMVTLPVLNEEIQLAASVERLRTFLATQRGYRWEIEIVDNGSTDRTWSIAQNLAAMHGSIPDGDDSSSAVASSEVAERVTVGCRRLVEQGRGRALKASWLASQADVLVYMDVDLSTDLSHLPALIDAITRQGFDVAVGSRLAPESAVTRCWGRELLSRGYNWLLRKALGLRVRDAQCGFKALSRKTARMLLLEVRDPGWFFDTELLVRAQREGLRIMELPVRWVEDRDSRVKVVSTVVEDLKGIWRLRRIRAQRETMNEER